jgi:AAA15 family ATPase/GTPase
MIHIGYSEPMLEKVAFKNFLALRDVEVDLEPFTVIVGPNACGKSTLLEGIHRICSVKNGSFLALASRKLKIHNQKSLNDDLNEVLSNSAKREISFSAKLAKPSGEISTMFADRSQNSEGWKIKIQNHIFRDLLDPHGNVNTDFLPASILIKPDGSRMSLASYSPIQKPYLESDGSGLATFCSYLQSEIPETFEVTQNSLRSIISTVERFRIKRERVNRIDWINTVPPSLNELNQVESVIGEKLVFDFNNAPNISAEFVSEGTLISLCVLVAAAGATDNHIVLLDDIERGLHPRAIKDLIAQLRALQQLNPGLQIVATTHSPYLLDYLEPQEIRVATMGDDGGMRIAPLTSHPEYERWKDAMAPGEFWSHVGESWVKNLEPEVQAAHD